MATAPKRGSNENNKIVRGSSNLGANMFEPHHAYPHVHSRNKLGAPSHGTSPSPRPHSHSGPWPLGPRSLTKSAKAPPNRQKKMKPNEIHGGWVPSLESVFSPIDSMVVSGTRHYTVWQREIERIPDYKNRKPLPGPGCCAMISISALR